MIINGGSRSNAAWFAKHLTNAEDNERVTLCEIKGLTAITVAEGFREMAAVASVTRCKNWFYHANINPRDTEKLTEEQWKKAIDLLEENLGLSGNARFIVEHKKQERTHRHVIWSRIDVDRLRAVPMTDDYTKHQATARYLERIFNLAPEKSVLGEDRSGPRPERRPKNWETFRGKRSGISPQAVKDEVTELWKTAHDGNAFVTELKKHGYILAKGDKRDFCILDKAGDAHSLARRITGLKPGELRDFMKDIDQASLPTVAEARTKINGA